MVKQFCRMFSSISDVDSYSVDEKLNDYLKDYPFYRVIAIAHSIDGSAQGIEKLIVVFESEEREI